MISFDLSTNRVIDKLIQRLASDICKAVKHELVLSDTAIENIKKLQLRRRFKRLPIGIKAELRDKFAKNPDCLHVDILNLSAIGAFVYGCGKFKLGDMVVMKFKLAPRQEEIEIEGKIVWLPDKQIQLPLSPGMGVEFINISSGIQEKLIEFIERNVSRMSSED